MKAKIKDVMSKQVISIKADMSFTEACRLFKNLKFHHLPVMDAKNNLVGMFSTTDAIYAVSNTLASQTIDSNSDINSLLKVEDIMTSNKLYTLEEDASIEDAIEIFQKYNIHSIPILSSGKLVGIITSNDMLRTFRAELTV